MRANRNLMESSQNTASGARKPKTLDFPSAGTGVESAAMKSRATLDFRFPLDFDFPRSTGNGRRDLGPGGAKLVAMATT